MEKMKNKRMETYVLISAVKNEEKFIEETCNSLVSQKILPREWIIVDDNSNDGTFEILKKYEKNYQFIKVIQNIKKKDRNFTSQVFAQMFGYKNILCKNYNYIGFLDGDLKFDELYYWRLIEIMSNDKQLGIAGGKVIDIFDKKDIRQGSEDYHVAGGVQFFRRACFEQISGYQPIEVGGQDTIAEVSAMLHGWKVRTTDELIVYHLKPQVRGNKSLIKINLEYAKQAYFLGYNPLFYIFSCFRRVGDNPLVGNLFYKIGFFLCFTVFNYKRPVNDLFITKIRSIQVDKIKKYFLDLII